MLKLLFCSLLALPLTVYAQSPVASSNSYKAYAGLGLNIGRYYDKRHGEVLNSGLLYSPVLVAGAQVVPSLALELSASTYQYKSDYTVQSLDYSAGDRNNPAISYVSGKMRRRYVILPLLARYTLTSSSERVKVDGLLGATIFYTSESAKTTLSDSQFRVTKEYAYSSNDAYANLVVGAGLRYALAPHLELAGEGRVNPFYFGYSVGFYPNLDLSMRYCFGAAKGKGATTSALPSKG